MTHQIELSDNVKKLLHKHYTNLRHMLSEGVPRRGVQKSFEELVYSIVGKDSWRPTHISELAVREYVEGATRNISEHTESWVREWIDLTGQCCCLRVKNYRLKSGGAFS